MSATAAPARLTEFDGLPPAYIDVDELNIFRDESVDYARRLWTVGISTELHVHPCAPHGDDLLMLESPHGARWKVDKIRVITGL